MCIILFVNPSCVSPARALALPQPPLLAISVRQEMLWQVGEQGCVLLWIPRAIGAVVDEHAVEPSICMGLPVFCNASCSWLVGQIEQVVIFQELPAGVKQGANTQRSETC
jgi:hypothetical protein